MNDARKPWMKPSIVMHRSGMINKFGSVQRSRWQDQLAGVNVSSLVEAHGSPLFVISEHKLRDNSRRLLHAFATRYPSVRHAWSYKTNYLGAVCRVLHQEGAWAEVVSGFEYEKARSLGVPGDEIVFNGPHKTRSSLERAIAEGARIQVDHLDELYLIESIARDAGRRVPIGIRLNYETGYTENWSRFGFNVESGQAMDAAWRIANSKNLELKWLHSHIGTFVLDHRAYGTAARIVAGFMNDVEQKTGCEIEAIDIGGGFASHNALQGIYLPPEQVVPSLDQYAEEICTPLLEATYERVARGRPLPTLILETGRAVVDEAESLVTTVVANKKMPDGRRCVIVDAGVNVLFTAFWYNHQITPTRDLTGAPEETVIYGPLCMNIDVIRSSILLPPVRTGDTLIVSPVGAYNNTQWLQFIEYRPRVVLVHGDAEVSVVRERETLATVTECERLPTHLVPSEDAGQASDPPA